MAFFVGSVACNARLPGGGIDEQARGTAMNSELQTGGFADRAEDSWTLPSNWYFDPVVHDLEREAIFYRTWHYQCHASDVATPGDYHVGRIADQSVFIVRDTEGALKAFYNVCSHRAHPLLEGTGNCRAIICPYHQWTYGVDGSFRGARGRTTLADWIPENADLKSVRVESFAGLVFANLDTEALPLGDQTGGFLDDLTSAAAKIDDLVRVESYEVSVAANWKTILDNNHECYHCSVNHPTLMKIVDYDSKARWSDDGITFTHGVERMLVDNGAYDIGATLEQEAMFGYIWPTTVPLVFPGSPSLFIFHLIPTGPETTIERWDFLLGHEEPSDQERRLMDYIKNVLVAEDVRLCENVQQGLHSRGYTQGRFVVDRNNVNFSEHHVHFFQKMVRDALAEDKSCHSAEQRHLPS